VTRVARLVAARAILTRAAIVAADGSVALAPRGGVGVEHRREAVGSGLLGAGGGAAVALASWEAKAVEAGDGAAGAAPPIIICSSLMRATTASTLTRRPDRSGGAS
jgi:hypothetical protein